MATNGFITDWIVWEVMERYKDLPIHKKEQWRALVSGMEDGLYEEVCEILGEGCALRSDILNRIDWEILNEILEQLMGNPNYVNRRWPHYPNWANR